MTNETVSGLLLAALLSSSALRGAERLGIFEGQTDIGTVLHEGRGSYDPTANSYTIAGSGANMWFAEDDFHFVWTKISALHVSIGADIDIPGTEGDGHRKGVLMIRQSLDTDSAYVDVARHGDGLTSLQYRETKGANTREIESDLSGPTRLRLEKQGDYFYLFLGNGPEKLRFAGGSVVVKLQAPFYIGVGVCAHSKNTVQTVSFRNLQISTGPPHHGGLYSTVETILLSTDARVGYVAKKRVTEPGWWTDGHSLTYNEAGAQRTSVFSPLGTAAKIGEPVSANTVSAEPVPDDEWKNTKPIVSPDGKYELFLSYGKDLNALPNEGPVTLRLMNLADKKVTTLVNFTGGPGSLGPHPWSPDGKRAVFVSYQDLQ